MNLGALKLKLPVSWARSMAEAQHTVVLTDDGNLFATGKGDFGRLGRGDTNDEVWGVLGATVAGGRGGVESVGISSFLVILLKRRVFWMWKTFFFGHPRQSRLAPFLQR